MENLESLVAVRENAFYQASQKIQNEGGKAI